MSQESAEASQARLGAPFIELNNVSVARGQTMVLQEICLRVEADECVAILGPNGCGKSTLLQVLTRELYPMVTPGMQVRLFGRERWDVTELRRRIGIVPSSPPARDVLGECAASVVVAGFFSAARLWPHLRPAASMREQALVSMRQLGVADLANRTLGTLSAGEQKRVLIARALCSSGDGGGQRVLVLDEPSNALDLRAQRELRETLERLALDGVGLVMVTHHTHDVPLGCGRVLLMQRGRIVADGAPADLLHAKTLSELYGVPLQVERRSGRYFTA